MTPDSRKTESTAISMFAGDGLVTANFRPALTTEQYDELLGIAIVGYNTVQELSDAIMGASARWGVECIVDHC